MSNTRAGFTLCNLLLSSGIYDNFFHTYGSTYISILVSFSPRNKCKVFKKFLSLGEVLAASFLTASRSCSSSDISTSEKGGDWFEEFHLSLFG